MRARSLSLQTMADLHAGQHGRCANKGCRAPIRVTGQHRSIKRDSNNRPVLILCKTCSVMLAMARNDRKRITGLVEVFDQLAAAEKAI